MTMKFDNHLSVAVLISFLVQSNHIRSFHRNSDLLHHLVEFPDIKKPTAVKINRQEIFPTSLHHFAVTSAIFHRDVIFRDVICGDAMFDDVIRVCLFELALRVAQSHCDGYTLSVKKVGTKWLKFGCDKFLPTIINTDFFLPIRYFKGSLGKWDDWSIQWKWKGIFENVIFG